MSTNFQLLMLSPNLLKSKNSLYSVCVCVCVWGGVMANYQLSIPSPNLLKSKNYLYSWGGGGADGQLPTFDAESKSAKIQKIPIQWGWVRLVPISNF